MTDATIIAFSINFAAVVLLLCIVGRWVIKDAPLARRLKARG